MKRYSSKLLSRGAHENTSCIDISSCHPSADALILVPMNSGFAQDTRERWAFGLHAGGNMWFNDYNRRVVGEGGELMARYGSVGHSRWAF